MKHESHLKSCSRSRAQAAALAIVLALVAFAPARAARYHVVASGGDDGNDGLSWAAPLATLAAAVSKAGDNDVIVLSNGTHGVTAQIDLTGAVTVIGTNGWQNTTVDAGNVAGRRVFYVANAGALIDGLTITRGNANNSSVPSQNGGGVWISDGRVQNCVITNNVGYPYGGNVYMAGGTISNCVLTRGNATYHQGGGAYINGGAAVLENSTIRRNSSTREGGGISIGAGGGTLRSCEIVENFAPNRANGAIIMSAGLVENCLVARNSAGNYYNRGTVSVIGGELRYCTIADNQSAGSSAGIWAGGGTVRNCIAYNNTLATGADSDVINAGAAITFSCAPELASGDGNTADNPEFEDRAAGNYRLAPGSACIDAGTNIAGVAADLDGAARPADGDGDGSPGFDMGCYEAASANGGDFRCNFTAPATEADGFLNAQFTAEVYGPQTNGLYYRWDYDNDGGIDAEGADKRSVSHLYGPGTYSVSLTVSNSNGDVAGRLKSAYITVYAAATYVATNGSHTSPFADWATAATNIQAAVDGVMEGGTVTISNGTYTVNANVSLSKAVAVRSLNGAAATTVQRGSATTRLFSLTHSNAVLDGFTLLNGISPSTFDRGGGVYMTDGAVLNCVLTNCRARVGGGVYLENGSVSNCTMAACRADQGGNSQAGGGVWMSGGLVARCEIFGGYSTRAASGVHISGGELRACRVHHNSGGWGAAVFMESGAGTLKNCLITDNPCTGTYRGGGGVYMNHAAARILNSTICMNTSGDEGGGVKCVSGIVSNSIIYYNTLSASGASDDIGGAAGTNNVYFSCAPELTADPGGTGNVSAEPVFTDKDNGDFRLGGGSPCIDSGALLADVTDDIDGAARPKDGDGAGGAAHDMGCYEAADAGAGPLSCNFSALTNEAPLSLTAIFEAVITGANTDNLYYWWDFENDGSADEQGYAKGTVSRTYGPGYYTVKLTVSNAVGEVASKTQVDYIKVFAAATYVATNGAHVVPFDAWHKAATNLQEAVDAAMAGGTVWVSNGTHAVNARVSLSKEVTVRSAGGADVAAVRKGSATTGLFGLSHAGAVIDGLTLLDGNTGSTTGGGVYMSDGTIRNCVLTNCYAFRGGGVYMTGGLVTNTTVTGCRASGGNPEQGGGIWMSDGLVVACDIVGNTTVRAASGVYMAGGELLRCRVRRNSGGWGAAIYMVGPCRARSCLVYGNQGGGYGLSLGDGGGIRMTHSGAHVENCTVVGNWVAAGAYGGYGGGINILNGGTVTNSVVYYNSAALGGDDFYIAGTGTNVGYTCTPAFTHDPTGSGVITNLPGFVSAGGGYGLSHTNGDYHLLKTSPCIDAGIGRPWMAGAADLDGVRRDLGLTVDLGAYESIPPQGTLLMVR